MTKPPSPISLQFLPLHLRKSKLEDLEKCIGELPGFMSDMQQGWDQGKIATNTDVINFSCANRII